MDDSIDDLRRREIEAAEAGDVEALLELRTDDFVAMPPGRPPARGKDEVASFLNGMFAATSIRESVTSEDVHVNGDLA
jgi:ketosteroid isomerase-like protein